MSEVLYLHQNFSDCMSIQYIYFDKSYVATSNEKFSGLIDSLKI